MQSMTTKSQIKHALLNTTAKQVASCVLYEYCKNVKAFFISMQYIKAPIVNAWKWTQHYFNYAPFYAHY